MQVNRQQFMEQGYLVVPEVIPPERLEQLRADFETLVDRQRRIWAQERGPDDPPGGAWETRPQPRLSPYEPLIDEKTASTVEVWLQENTLGVSRQLMCVPEATSVAGMTLMCNPVRDHGPAPWHRDVHPIDMAPMAGLQNDLLENGPRVLQWNIPLYDDDVLWIVPGSHRRLNTETEDRELLADPRKPLTGGIPVELKAGDGVVYVNYLLHWGSNYSTRIRRTVHGGHSIFPHFPDLSFSDYLSPEGRTQFRAWQKLGAAQQDLTETALRGGAGRRCGQVRQHAGGAAAWRGRGRQDVAVDLSVQGRAAYAGCEAQQRGRERLVRPAGGYQRGPPQKRAQPARDFDQLGAPVRRPLHAGGDGRAAEALRDAGQETAGG